MQIVLLHTSVIVVSTSPGGIFVKLWYSFGDIFWNCSYQNLRTHRLCKQMQTGRIPPVILFAHHISIYGGATSSVLHSQLRALRIRPLTGFICSTQEKNTWHFQLMCFKSTYFWDCRSGRALLAPVAPALHSDAWRVRCWRSLGLVSIYNSSWWVAEGTHLPVS